MLFLYIAMLLLPIGGIIACKFIHHRIVPYIIIGLSGAILLGSIFVGKSYGEYLFQYDDPHLGGWIFMVVSLLVGFALAFAATYRRFPIASKICLGIAFVLACILLVMCIYEAKVSFGNGINSNSPGKSSEDVSAWLS